MRASIPGLAAVALVGCVGLLDVDGFDYGPGVGGDGGESQGAGGDGGATTGCDPACDATTERCDIDVCVCQEDLVACPSGCVDPMTDNGNCGADAACDGGVACGMTGVCTDGMCEETCENCSFETGDFTGWTTVDLAMPYQDLEVVADGDSKGGFTIMTTDGMWAAFHGFDGSPGTIEISQDMTFSDAPAKMLRFDYRGEWSIFGSSQSRTFHVNVCQDGEMLVNELLLTATGDDTVDANGEIDVSGISGDVTVQFIWTIPEDFTGPAGMQLDNVRVVAP